MSLRKSERNAEIFTRYKQGVSRKRLSIEYKLTVARVSAIIQDEHLRWHQGKYSNPQTSSES